MFLQTPFYVSGAQLQELLDELGRWNRVFRRFPRWLKANTFYRIFKALVPDANFEYAMIDGTIVVAHHSGQGARSQP